jgi:hypothetical protein
MRPINSWGLTAALLLGLGAAGPGVAGEQPPGQRDLVRVRTGPQDEPWLRIDAGGHTAAVRALAFTPDSQRLCSAGLDKNVELWNLSALRDLRRVFLRERTIHWQIARGLRGNIYALAMAPDDGLLAIGGYGAMGSLGEILLVDPVRGTLSKVLEGHRQPICGLAFSRDGKWLGSIDVAGETRLWQRGAWTPLVLYGQDRETYGAQRAAMIEKQPKLRPLAFLGSSHLVVPTFASEPGEVRLRWRLLQIRVDQPGDFRALDTIHYGLVTAMAASPDGARLASADSEGHLYLWDLAHGGSVESLPSAGIVLALCFSPDGGTLVVGTLGGPAAGGQLQVWDLATRALTRKVALADSVYACAVSPDGKRLAYTGGANGEVFVESPGGTEKPAVLRGTGRRIGKVAFAKEEPYYRVAFGPARPGRELNDNGDLQEEFDPLRLSLGTKAVNAADWLAADWSSGGWTVRPQRDGSLQLLRDGTPQGTIVLRPQVPGLDEGTPRCYCWVPDAAGKPLAIAVGTNLQDSIYVCRLSPQGPCPILRHFRGHSDAVTSVGVSRDLRYLVSGSADGTLRFWSLADYLQGALPAGRWGATFEVRGEQLRLSGIHPAGPLFRKGMRGGDVLTGLRWADGQGEHGERRAAAMLEKLQSLPWGTQLVFEYSRNGAARPAFQLLPAWQPLATLFIATTREWAFWTPEGYYDASMNGYRLFGWQVNRGLQRLPDFYGARQFYRELERPRVLERLLPAGSLHQALEQAAVVPKLPQHEVLPAQIAATPRIEILAPLSGVVLAESAPKLKVRIDVPSGCKLVGLRAFANGVVSTRRELLSERAIEGGKEALYQWEMPLSSDPKHLLEVVADTDMPTAAFGDVIVQRSAPAWPQQRPQMYVLCLGINRYADPQIQPLAFPVADAQAVADLLRSRAAGLYEVQEVRLLANQEATPARWNEALDSLRAKLKDRAKPDDLLVFFLAGHGIVDDDTRKYYYVGHDFTLANLNQRVYTACISCDDFRTLAEVPCRKIVMLDTCHSGAIQLLRSRGLKAAVRELEADVILTVTASTGEQRAAEKAEWQHGVFTRCLLDALEGQAGPSGGGIVTLDELVRFVKQAVPKLTSGLQTPTAAPDEILPFTAIPLTRGSHAVSGRK